jgi:two-component system, cell cycle response regulator DivK
MQIVNFEGDVKKNTQESGRVAVRENLSVKTSRERISLFLFSTTATHPPKEKENSSSAEHTDPDQKQVILVAEDDDINFFYLSIILRHPKVEVIHAKDGLDAVNLFREHPEITMVLMDLKMPRMNGFEATVRIKELNSSIPVIAITSYADDQSRQMALEAGCDDFLTKPVEKETLVRKIAEFGVQL